jgi:DNA-3-methyladenine glycosylase II
MPHVKHLSKDKILSKAIKKVGRIELKKRQNIFIRLCGAIMSQQLSTRVAEVIFNRFIYLYEGKEPTPQQVLDTKFETLRATGLSNAKISYIQNVARFAIEHGIETKKLSKLDNEEIIEYLTRIKGVGRWTVEMQLMFTLGREDILALDDLGIQQAIAKLYNLKTTDRKKLKLKMTAIAEAWSPYRTYACMYLWRWKDGEK